MHSSTPRTSAQRRATPEADIQRQIVAVLKLILPKGAIVHHSANETRIGGREGKIQQAILTGMGIHPGFADLLILSEGRVLFLEVKSKTGSLSPAQEAFRDLLVAQGFAWALVRNVDDLLAALGAHGFRYKAIALQ